MSIQVYLLKNGSKWGSVGGNDIYYMVFSPYYGSTHDVTRDIKLCILQQLFLFIVSLYPSEGFMSFVFSLEYFQPP